MIEKPVPKAVIHNCTYSHHGQWHLHTKRVVMFHITFLLNFLSVLLLHLYLYFTYWKIMQISSHNIVQTLHKLKNSVCYDTLFLFSFPYLSLILFFCFEVPGINFLTEFHQNKDKKLVCIDIYTASSSVVWNVKITGTILINTTCLLCTIRGLIK